MYMGLLALPCFHVIYRNSIEANIQKSQGKLEKGMIETLEQNMFFCDIYSTVAALQVIHLSIQIVTDDRIKKDMRLS